MIYAVHNGVRVVNIIDHKATPLSHQQYLDALGLDSLMQEPATLEEIEATYLYGLDGRGEQAFTDAIVTTKNRIDRTMAGFVRALNQALAGTEITAADPKIGDPRKAGDVAVLSAELPLSDGQSIFVIFHSPSNDPTKITSSDVLVAFRFLLNKRDVTHVVAPNKGRDISLKQTCMALSNLAERNSSKFAAKLADNKAKAEELATLETDTDQQMKQADLLAQQVDTLAEANSGTDAELAKVNKQLDKQHQRNEELRQLLASLQAEKGQMPAAADPNPPQQTPGDEAKGVLLTLQNQPKAGGTLGGLKVLNATDRLIDVTPGTPGVAATRYTWDGIGFKRRGQYLLTNGGSIPMEQVSQDTVKLNDLPEDGLRYVKQQLSIHGKMTLTNGAVISLNSYDKNGELEGFVSITATDGTVYRLDSPSSQGGAMQDTASKLYRAYRDGKAGKHLAPASDPEEPIAEQIKTALEPLMGSYGEGWKSVWDELDDEPVISLNTPMLPGDQEHDGYYIKANLGTDGKPAGSFRVLYGDGGPITGGTEITTKDEARALVGQAYQKDYDEAFAKLNPEPAKPTPPAEQADPVNPTEQPPEATPLYWYGLRIRPYSPSAQPDGVIAHIPQDDVAGDPRVADLIKDRDPTSWRHGMVAYPDPLTKDQIDHYSLEDMAAAVWTEGSRAARLAELEDVVSRMVELEQTDDEIWAELFMPKGSLTATNNPFFVDGKYESGQLTQALQEAGYTGSVKSMSNNLIDKARAAAKLAVTDELSKKLAELPTSNVSEWIEGARDVRRWLGDQFAENAITHDEYQTLAKQIDEQILLKSASLEPEMKPLKEAKTGKNGETLVNLNTVYGDSVWVSQSSLDGSKTMLPLYNSKGDKLSDLKSYQGRTDTSVHRGNLVIEQAPEPISTTSNQWDEAEPAILALLEQLEALRTDESDYEVYLEKMGRLIEQLEQAGAVERHEPFLHKVADRLTELMEAAA